MSLKGVEILGLKKSFYWKKLVAGSIEKWCAMVAEVSHPPSFKMGDLSKVCKS